MTENLRAIRNLYNAAKQVAEEQINHNHHLMMINDELEEENRSLKKRVKDLEQKRSIHRNVIRNAHKQMRQQLNDKS